MRYGIEVFFKPAVTTIAPFSRNLFSILSIFPNPPQITLTQNLNPINPINLLQSSQSLSIFPGIFCMIYFYNINYLYTVKPVVLWDVRVSGQYQ